MTHTIKIKMVVELTVEDEYMLETEETDQDVIDEVIGEMEYALAGFDHKIEIVK